MPDSIPPHASAQHVQDGIGAWVQISDEGSKLSHLSTTDTNLSESIAAISGDTFAVTPEAGEVIIMQLDVVQDSLVELMRSAEGLSWLPSLGGGFAQEIGEFNQRLASGEQESAQAALVAFHNEIEMLRRAVVSSMSSYRDADAGGARAIESAGKDLE